VPFTILEKNAPPKKGGKFMEEQLGFILKSKLNELALNLNRLSGFDVDPEHDFSLDKIGPGLVAWNQACVAWAVLHDDKAVLKFQN